MANTSAVYARIDAKLKENAEAILAQLGITPSALIQMTYSQVVLHNGLPFSARIPAKAPTAVGRMTQEQLDAELRKGVESFNKGSFTTDEIDQALGDRREADRQNPQCNSQAGTAPRPPCQCQLGALVFHGYA